MVLAGDLVGYGPEPEEVVRRLRSLNPIAIRGDMDELVLGLDPPGRDRDAMRPAKRRAVEWTARQLSTSSRRYLASLPRSCRLGFGSHRIELVHGSPASFTEHVDPGTSEARLRELASASGGDWVIFGHSHLPFEREAEGVRFVNPGSVGRSADGDPRAAYGVLESEPGGRLSVRLHRVEYDVEAVARDVLAAGMDEAVARMFLRGRGLGRD